MATKKQYENHAWMLEQLKTAQDADHDMRVQVREVHNFVDKRDGQWEQEWYDKNQGKPRYTFDMCNPIIDQIHGYMERMDFDITVRPQTGDASKEVAEAYDGLIRNIENISQAKNIYDRAGREVITAGFDCWEVVQDYVDGDSFDQDLFIKKIPNAVDRVWLGPHTEPDGSDAKMGWVLSGLTEADYKAKYPDRSVNASVDVDKEQTSYFHRQDLIVIGQFRYLLPVERTLVLMTNGNVYEDNAEFKQVADDLQRLGFEEQSRRTRKVLCMYVRNFDVNGWIDDKPKETVFKHWLNIVPCYGNFKVFDDKVTYWGAVEKLLDAQRVLNYSLSREIEEGALAPREKFMATEKQVKRHARMWESMNTDNSPVLLYDVDPDAPQPYKISGAQINPGLANITAAMKDIMGQSAGMFHASMGDNPGLQSGVAIQQLQDRGDQGNSKYMTARAISQTHTGRILVDAIPRVYTTGRQVRILDADGTFDVYTIGTQVQDAQTGEMVTINELSEGKYDVYCSVAPSFKSRQSETASTIIEMAKVDSSTLEMGADIVFKNIPSPGMDQIAERKRRQLFMAGLIPETQMTEEEKQEMAQMQAAQAEQGQQGDPNMVMAQGEYFKGQAAMISEQTAQVKVQGDLANTAAKIQIDAYNAETKRAELSMKQGKTAAEIEKLNIESVATLQQLAMPRGLPQ